MNRTIKFRGWLTEENKMVYSDNQASLDCCEIWEVGCNISIKVQETFWSASNGEPSERIEYIEADAKIMQFTGLHDKNGKEIYEGDIVNQYSGGYGSWDGYIIFKQDSATFFIETFNEFPSWIAISKHAVVIGNIYETPKKNKNDTKAI